MKLNRHLMNPTLTVVAAGVAATAFGFAGHSGAVKATRQPPAKHEAPQNAMRITWQPSFEDAVKKAKAENKLVMVDFYASWCGACKMMDQQTYPNAKVIAASRDFVNVRVDVEKREDIAGKYGISSLPTIAWLRADGKPVGGIEGAYPPDDFIAAMRKAQKKFKS